MFLQLSRIERLVAFLRVGIKKASVGFASSTKPVYSVLSRSHVNVVLLEGRGDAPLSVVLHD